ncbi:MAG: YceI family protein, partial [Acidimicrobiales bacterium]
LPRVEEFRFGHVDRPAVYRALAQLEADGLVESCSEQAKAGQARRVYRATATGERVLREWMGIIKEEHERLALALRRYQATGTADAALAEVGGAWATALGCGWSPLAPTAGMLHRMAPPLHEPHGTEATAAPTDLDPPPSNRRTAAASRGRFLLVEDRSVVLIEARSTAGPLVFGVDGVHGWVEASVTGTVICTDSDLAACLEIDVTGLSSGNRVHDAELLRRIDACRYPTATVELERCTANGADNLYRLEGRLTFHGVTRTTEGTVRAAVSGGHIVVTGEQVFDIRDFSIPSPSVLMLRIYPDVRVRLHVEAELEEEA